MIQAQLNAFELAELTTAQLSDLAWKYYGNASATELIVGALEARGIDPYA